MSTLAPSSAAARPERPHLPAGILSCLLRPIMYSVPAESVPEPASPAEPAVFAYPGRAPEHLTPQGGRD